MKYRVLKRANLKVSEIGFGCMSLGENHAENTSLLQAAYSAGINYYDTADIYQNGFNEETVGRAIKPFRKEVILATKAGNEPKSTGQGWDWNPSKSYILKAVDKSLHRLQTDYIDLYQLHGGTIEDNWQDVIEAFEILKGQGKILHYGISSIRPNVIRRYATKTAIVSDMLQYSLLDRRAEERMLPLLQEMEVGVFVRGALAKGKLVNKDLSNYLNYSPQSIEYVRNKVDSFSIEKMTRSQFALRWILKSPTVTSIVLGIRKMSQLEDAVGIFNYPEMTDETYEKISASIPLNFYVDHRE